VLVLAAGAAAVVRFVVYGHDVPRLRGLPLAASRRAVEREGLRIEIASARPYSSAVAAGSVLDQSPPPGRDERRGYDVRVVLSGGHAPVAVPSVLGDNGSTAVAMLRSSHLHPRVVVAYDETVAPGKVVSADPSSGTVAYGHEVTVTVSRGPSPRTIPSGLVGSPWSKVGALVTDLRLRPVEKLAYSSTVPAGDVVATEPASGATGVRVGSTVDVVVSRGPRLVVVPPVDGLSIESAISALEARGLAVTEQVGPPNSTYATATDPLAGASVAPGTDVTLYVA
jgi:serine/threonine-protein kinase